MQKNGAVLRTAPFFKGRDGFRRSVFLIGALEDTLLMSTGMAGQKGGCQTEDSGGEQPAQAQIVQGRLATKGMRTPWAVRVHSTLVSSAPMTAPRLMRSGTRGISREIKISTSVGG